MKNLRQRMSWLLIRRRTWHNVISGCCCKHLDSSIFECKLHISLDIYNNCSNNNILNIAFQKKKAFINSKEYKYKISSTFIRITH